MTDAMDVDAPASLFMAWAGPMPHSVHQEPALAFLQRTYKVSTIVNERSINGTRFYKVAFAAQPDLASAIEKSPTFFRGQFVHVLNDLQVWLNDRSAADKNAQVLCDYKAVRHLPKLLAKGRVLLVDNCRARTFSRVLWHYEKQQDAVDAISLTKLAINGHDLLFFAGSVRLCYSCGESGHVKSACPSKPIAKTPSAGPMPIFAPVTSAGGVSYADAAKQAIEKVDKVDKDLRAEVASLSSTLQAMQDQLSKFCAQQDALLATLKLEQDKLREDLVDVTAVVKDTVHRRYTNLSRDLKATDGVLDDLQKTLVSLEMRVEDLEQKTAWLPQLKCS